MKITKSFLSMSIASLIFIGFPSNAITGVEYMTKPDWYKNLYNTFLSAEIKEAELARKSMVINGMTEVQWLEKNAKTINAVQRVVRTDNATTVPFRLVTPESQAAQSLVPAILETALSWPAQILISLGRLSLDLVKNSIEDASNTNGIPNPNPPSVTLSPINTPAGVRVKKSLSGQLSITQTGATTAAYLDPVTFGGIVLRTSSCPSNDLCSLLPTTPAVTYGYPFSANITYTETRYYPDTPAYRNLGLANSPYYVAIDAPYAIAYFKTINEASSYISSRFVCSFPVELINGSIVGADCKATLKSIINADYTSISHTITQTMIDSRGLINIPYSYLGVHAMSRVSLNTYLLDSYFTNIDKVPFYKSELDSKVPKSLLVAHLNNLLKRASQLPDYDGLPYSPTDPIRESEISDRNVTLRDLLGATTTEAGELYISPDGKTEDPIVIQYVINNTCVGNNTCNNDTGKDIDLTAPSAVEPKLEPTPTAISILQPLLDLLPNYKITTISHVAGVCPTVTFDTQFGDPGGAYYRSWLIDHHCTMFEDFRSMISSIFMVLFAFASFRIVMKA